MYKIGGWIDVTVFPDKITVVPDLKKKKIQLTVAGSFHDVVERVFVGINEGVQKPQACFVGTGTQIIQQPKNPGRRGTGTTGTL